MQPCISHHVRGRTFVRVTLFLMKAQVPCNLNAQAAGQKWRSAARGECQAQVQFRKQAQVPQVNQVKLFSQSRQQQCIRAHCHSLMSEQRHMAKRMNKCSVR